MDKTFKGVKEAVKGVSSESKSSQYYSEPMIIVYFEEDVEKIQLQIHSTIDLG